MTAQFEAGPKKGTVILFLDFCFKLSQLLVAAISQFIINHPGAHHPSVCMWCNVSQTQMAFSLGEYLAQGSERGSIHPRHHHHNPLQSPQGVFHKIKTLPYQMDVAPWCYKWMGLDIISRWGEV